MRPWLRDLPSLPPGVSQATEQAQHCFGALEAGPAGQSSCFLCTPCPLPIYLSPKGALLLPKTQTYLLWVLPGDGGVSIWPPSPYWLRCEVVFCLPTSVPQLSSEHMQPTRFALAAGSGLLPPPRPRAGSFLQPRPPRDLPGPGAQRVPHPAHICSSLVL